MDVATAAHITNITEHWQRSAEHPRLCHERLVMDVAETER